MEGLFSYMTESEKDLELITVLTENRLNHISLEIDKLLFEHAENISALELKVMMESGSAEDLEYFYTKEAEEVKQKSQGLISKLFSAIVGFLKKIKETLFGATNNIKDENLPNEVKLEKDPKQIVEEGNKFSKAINNILTNHKVELAIFATAAAATTAAVVINKDKIKSTTDDLKKFINQQEKQYQAMQAKSEKADLNPEELSGLKKGMKKVQENIGEAKRALESILKAATGNAEFKDIHNETKLQNASEARGALADVSNKIAQFKQQIEKHEKVKTDTLASIKNEKVKVGKKTLKGAEIINEFNRLKKSNDDQALINFNSSVGSKIQNAIKTLANESEVLKKLNKELGTLTKSQSSHQANVNKAEKAEAKAKADQIRNEYK